LDVRKDHLDLLPYTFRHDERISVGLSVADPERSVALASEPGVTVGIVQLRFREIVTRAVDFDDESAAMVRKVGDGGSHRDLSADMQLQRAKRFPQVLLARGHLATQMAGARSRATDISRAFENAGALGPNTTNALGAAPIKFRFQGVGDTPPTLPFPH
jgi:hypothetical protein